MFLDVPASNKQRSSLPLEFLEPLFLQLLLTSLFGININTSAEILSIISALSDAHLRPDVLLCLVV